MRLFDSNVVFPCAKFFSQGRVFFGVSALLMQLSLVFWPAATRWARAIGTRSEVDRLLAEFSAAHRLPEDPYPAPTKRFRRAA
jgi:hypothetical protein